MLVEKSLESTLDAETLNNQTVYRLFKEMAAKAPHDIAILCRDEAITYAELLRKVDRIAHGLRASHVKKNDVVAIMMKRSIDVIAGILAILKAGAAYLPIDPEYPEQRKTYMLTDSRASLLVTHSQVADKADYGNVLYMEELDSPDHDRSVGEYEEPAPDDLAYIIYTSGSTGKPKGVIIEQKSVVNFIDGIAAIIDFKEGKNILALTTISFDIFVLETLLPLSRGLTVVLADEATQKNPKLLAEAILKNGIDMLQITPSMMQLLVSRSENQYECLRHVKEIMIGGEPLPQSLLDNLQRHTSAKIYNMYGPTETTVWSTVSDVTGKTAIDIGKPILHTQVYVMDEQNQLVPEGREGELCIGGRGVAKGYLHRPELTLERFVPNPFIPGERIYKTGDRVKLLPDGNLQYIGRIDNQVKIRGHRIELEEIEAVLFKHTAVKQVAVSSWHGQENNAYLCAYYLSDYDVAPADLREFLSHQLPDYMIPAYFMKLDALPQTLNGKIDRKALPEPGHVLSVEPTHAAVSSEDDDGIVSKLKDIVRSNIEVSIPLESIGVDSQLTNLGIHSISFIKIVVSIETEFEFEFEDGDIDATKFPTVQHLASYIESRMAMTD